ncbi:MAG: cytochrome c3 family protein [Alphaproteobacteria bacterium]|nr:cytochrome c3 family protein [Alphaproteobacteria bacterium]
MAQLFRPGANSIAVVVLVAILVVPAGALTLTYFLWKSPYATDQYLTPAQPVPFSHAHHAGDLGLDCRMCHTGVEKAAFAGIPATHICMTCHSRIWTNAGMLAPVRHSLASDTPLHWRRVNRLPDYVFFDHSIHVAKGIGCSECHGPVQKMALMRQERPLTMGWCLQCHRHVERRIRPRDQVFNMDWRAPPDQDAMGRALIAKYFIHTAHLTDCSTCHR